MSRRFARGLVVGKFCPLHLGHELLIRRAIEQCGEAFVISFTNPDLPGFDPDRRRRWFAARFPEVRWVVFDASESPHDDAPVDEHREFCGWACVHRFGATVEAVFTSESYGDGFAAVLSRYFGHPVEHVLVDQSRAQVPISGTALRTDPHAHRRFLAPEVYADFVERICILGAESSGKTTLAEALAKRLDTILVPEYGRERWIEKGGRLEFDDLLHIGRQQVLRETSLAREAKRWLVCDTSPLTTLHYSEALFHRVAPELRELAKRQYHMVILCETDFGFHQDGTRQNEAFQQAQQRWYERELAARGIDFLRVRGPVAARLEQIAAAIEVMRGTTSPAIP